MVMICVVIMTTLSPLSNNALAASVGFKRQVGWFNGPISVYKIDSSTQITSAAKVTASSKISFGTLCHFVVDKTMPDATISVDSYLVSDRLGDDLSAASISKAEIHYRKPTEEFQIWGNRYVVCEKNEPCYYEIFAHRFPEGLKMLGYCCMTNYAPSQVTNAMMK